MKQIKRLGAFVVALTLILTDIPAIPVLAAGVKAPKIDATATVQEGDTINLSITDGKFKVKKIKSVKSSDKSVATGAAEGKTGVAITGVKEGTATITTTVKAKKGKKNKTFKLKTVVTVTAAPVVTNVITQAELDAALTDTSLTSITISGDGTSFTIPAGEYKTVDLIVDAPKASVVNNGVFKSITIKSIAPNTFTENAVGNIISFVNAAAARIIVGANAVVSALNIGGTGVTAVQVQGEVTGVEVAGTGKADIVADAGSKIDAINVTGAKSEVALSGKTTDAIKVNVEATAEGAKVESSTKVEVTNEAKDTEVKLEAGAAGSTVETKGEEATTKTENATGETITVTDNTGATTEVATGETGTTTGEGTSTETTPEPEPEPGPTPEPDPEPTPDPTPGGGGSGDIGGYKESYDLSLVIMSSGDGYNHGSVTLDASGLVEEGTLVTASVTPEAGYYTSYYFYSISDSEQEVVLTEVEGDKTYTFTMPAANTTVYFGFAASTDEKVVSTVTALKSALADGNITTIYYTGSTDTLTDAIEIPKTVKLIIDAGANLVIGNGGSIKNNGQIECGTHGRITNGGTIQNTGKIIDEGESTGMPYSEYVLSKGYYGTDLSSVSSAVEDVNSEISLSTTKITWDGTNINFEYTASGAYAASADNIKSVMKFFGSGDWNCPVVFTYRYAGNGVVKNSVNGTWSNEYSSKANDGNSWIVAKYTGSGSSGSDVESGHVASRVIYSSGDLNGYTLTYDVDMSGITWPNPLPDLTPQP